MLLDCVGFFYGAGAKVGRIEVSGSYLMATIDYTSSAWIVTVHVLVDEASIFLFYFLV